MILPLLFALAAHASPWIERSNHLAQEYAFSDAELVPERASAVGFPEFDAKALHMQKNENERETAFLARWQERLGAELAKADDENLRVDLKILRDHLRLRTEEIRLDEKYGVVSYFAGTRFVLESLLTLLNAQASPARKAAAIDRFHKYVNGEGDEAPLLTAFRNRTLADVLRFRRKKLMPLRSELEQYLAESPSYLKGVRELLEQSGRSDWAEDYKTFAAQSAAYDEFVRVDLMPLARKDFRLPKEIYAHTLRMRGIEASPAELIRSARADYKILYKEFRQVAREVAKQEKLTDPSPAAVIAHLKLKQVLKPEEVKPLFENAANTLDGIIRREHLVSLPATPLRIRVAGEAESMANPVPHLTEPRFIGNQGERPEFVVPSYASGQTALDDFSFAAAAIVLTAHEGRPGHDLQFSSMLDHGTSVIRAHYAMNNSNVEGWGLYAEEMVYPYLPLEAKLVALQMRLIRVARAFLDPELQLGKIAPAAVPKFLRGELGISPRLAALELRRYQFDNPGQAPSYFYGLERVEGARRRFIASQGKSFNNRCFHDGVLSLGILPVKMIEPELEKSRPCGRGQASVPEAVKAN